MNSSNPLFILSNLVAIATSCDSEFYQPVVWTSSFCNHFRRLDCWSISLDDSSATPDVQLSSNLSIFRLTMMIDSSFLLSSHGTIQQPPTWCPLNPVGSVIIWRPYHLFPWPRVKTMLGCWVHSPPKSGWACVGVGKLVKVSACAAAINTALSWPWFALLPAFLSVHSCPPNPLCWLTVASGLATAVNLCQMACSILRRL